MSKYIYTHFRLWHVDHRLDTHKHGGITVDEDTLICYDVQPNRKEDGTVTTGFTFKIEGKGDTVFKCYYDWALAEDTPENRKRLAAWREQKMLVEEEQARAEKLHAQILNAGLLRNKDDAG